MTQRDIEEGSISVVVGLAPLRPAEFVVSGSANGGSPQGWSHA